MKRLTLDETWKQCLEMWKWIAKQVRGGDKDEVWHLKVRWLEAHGIGEEDINSDCFFCEYTGRWGNRFGNCGICPAVKVDPDFRCQDTWYDFEEEPIKFYNKISRIYRIYKKRSKK